MSNNYLLFSFKVYFILLQNFIQERTASKEVLIQVHQQFLLVIYFPSGRLKTGDMRLGYHE